MFVLRKLTLIIPAIALAAFSAGLTSCSIIPFPQNWNAAEEEEASTVKTAPQLPKIMPNTSKNASLLPSSNRLSGTAIDNLAQQARDTKLKLLANAQLADLEDENSEFSKSSAKSKNSAQLMAQNLLKGRKAPSQGAGVKNETESFVPNVPKTYRLDGPQQMAMNTPQNVYQQNYTQQGYYNPQMGYQNQGYPPNPTQFQPPPNMGQSGFMPPDSSPVSQKPGTDPKALMEAVERMRSRQAIQPTRQTPKEEQTGTLASQNKQADPQPTGPLTFLQFERGSTLLNAAGQKSLVSMLAPHTRAKKAKVYLNAGLGGEGEAYTKLLNANQRAQAISERIPAQFEVIRRFDPGLPNESVRLFVIE